MRLLVSRVFQVAIQSQRVHLCKRQTAGQGSMTAGSRASARRDIALACHSLNFAELSSNRAFIPGLCLTRIGIAQEHCCCCCFALESEALLQFTALESCCTIVRLGACFGRCCAQGSQMSTIPVQLTLPAQHKSQNVDFPDTATWCDVRKRALEWSKLSAEKAKVGIRGREIDDKTPLTELKSTHRKLQAQVTVRTKKDLTDDSGSSSKADAGSKPKAQKQPPKTMKHQIDSACAGLISHADRVCQRAVPLYVTMGACCAHGASQVNLPERCSQTSDKGDL